MKSYLIRMKAKCRKEKRDIFILKQYYPECMEYMLCSLGQWRIRNIQFTAIVVSDCFRGESVNLATFLSLSPLFFLFNISTSFSAVRACNYASRFRNMFHHYSQNPSCEFFLRSLSRNPTLSRFSFFLCFDLVLFRHSNFLPCWAAIVCIFRMFSFTIFSEVYWSLFKLFNYLNYLNVSIL